jgi:hypothetical protein
MDNGIEPLIPTDFRQGEGCHHSSGSTVIVTGGYSLQPSSTDTRFYKNVVTQQTASGRNDTR